jgi:hypothetical protein
MSPTIPVYTKPRYCMPSDPLSQIRPDMAADH